MKHAALLDCTLRDGAYLIDKYFGDPVIKGIVHGLMDAGIDYIEIGFFQDEGFGPGKTVFRNAADARRFVPDEKGKTQFSVLADYSRYSVDNLDENPGDSVDMIRECFFKHERFGAMEVCAKIKEKGYKVSVQPVDILGYSDAELLDLLERCNKVEPCSFCIVDTFGSMYEEDLERVFSLIDHNLDPRCKVGFHSHNNLQMSNALSQAFLRISQGRREVIVDGTISGMGRGAGNTPTELIAEYMVAKLGYSYDMDCLLDIMDGYMDNIRARCSWGYTTPYFLAGCYSAHVNNVNYLTKKNSIRSRDIRFILNKMGAGARKRYPYDMVDQIYLEYMQSDIDDEQAIDELKKQLGGRNIVVLVPGRSASTYAEGIAETARKKNAVVIAVNFVHDTIPCDIIYMSNIKRYQYWRESGRFHAAEKILTSNIPLSEGKATNTKVVSFARLVKCGWEHLDNSTILLLRLLDLLDAASIDIAGFDGYSYETAEGNYALPFLELSNVKENPTELNNEIADMLRDFRESRKGNAEIRFLTPSRFSHVLES